MSKTLSEQVSGLHGSVDQHVTDSIFSLIL